MTTTCTKRVASRVLVARRVAIEEAGINEGAVNSPMEEIVPVDAVHVTLPLAVNCRLWPSSNVALAGGDDDFHGCRPIKRINVQIGKNTPSGGCQADPAGHA